MEEVGVITEVTESDEHYGISTDQSTSFGLSKEYGVTPKVGDKFVLHCYQGSLVRGLNLNGKLVYYKSDEQLERERQEWLEKNRREKQEAFLKNKAEMDAEYEALPANFQKRIDRFRENNPRFRVDFESYELFCCNEAVKIALACKTVEEIKVFRGAGWEIQKEIVSDGHSGNTFGCACLLAQLHLESPESVSKLHGALSPLVGSKKYGDISCAPTP